MAVLVICTNRGVRCEAEVRDARDAEREINYFQRKYLVNHPDDRIINASVILNGNVVARYHNGRLENF